MPIIKSFSPFTQNVPIYSVFDAPENTLHSFRYRKWAAVEYETGETLPFHKSSRLHKHDFYKYLVWDKNPDAAYGTNTFVFRGDDANLLNAFHYVPMSSTDELTPPLSLSELQALADQHNTYLHIPPDQQSLINQFQIIETFLSLAMARANAQATMNMQTNLKWYRAYEIEDLLEAFTRWHLKSIGIATMRHFNHDLLFLACRRLRIELAIDNPRPYFNSVQNGRLRNLIKLPFQLPGTVLNYTTFYPSRIPRRLNSGFRQQLHERDIRMMIEPPRDTFLESLGAI